MSALTAGNWIAFQNESQIQYKQWSIGIENRWGIHGVSDADGDYTSMCVAGICTEADAKAMAASKELASALAALVNSFEKHRPKELWDNARAALAKAGIQ